MDKATYAVEDGIEESHWWFVGRRRLFAREIRALGLPVGSPVLDAGTSTGTNLRMLRDLGLADVRGLEVNDEAIRLCALKGLGPVHRGDVCDMPFGDSSFALVLATDIIEHVDEDLRALREVARVLRPGGWALLTVPTFASLWGQQDACAHHKRRYRLGPLLRLVREAGLSPERHYYFNYLLFLPILVARRLIGLLNVKLESENQLNLPIVNRVLTTVFDFDVRSAPVLRPPFGVSALVLARRRAAE